MLSIHSVRRTFPLALALTAALALSACGDPTEPDEDEPEVAAIVIANTTTGTTTTINNVTGAQAGGLTLRANQANALTVRFLDAANANEPVITANPGDFQVRIYAGTSTTNSFTATGGTHPFAGTLTTTASGTAAFRLALFHTGEGHEEISRPFTATIVP